MSREAGYHKLFQTHLWLWGLHARIFGNEIASCKHGGSVVCTQREELPLLVAVCRRSTHLTGAAFQGHGPVFYPIRAEERNLWKLQNKLHIFYKQWLSTYCAFSRVVFQKNKRWVFPRRRKCFYLKKNCFFLNHFDFKSSRPSPVLEKVKVAWRPQCPLVMCRILYRKV